jgi:hypothetical protein
MYSDRFLQVPQVRYYKLDPQQGSDGEIYGDYMAVETFRRFNVLSIISYEPDKGVEIPEDHLDYPYTLVHLKDGVSFVAQMNINDFETLINAHFAKINSN